MLGLAEQAADVMRTVDKLDKIGAEKVERCSCTEDCGRRRRSRRTNCWKFIAITGTDDRRCWPPWRRYGGQHALL